jgi:8-oxo-dGTP pyrophosphatase MutT (NUDIX family)
MIKVKIKKILKESDQDAHTVAKAVIIDSENRVLMLTRSDYHKKYAGELDLPGGHLKENESINKGLEREVKEETGLDILHPAFFKKVKNKHFYHARYDSQPINISDEHVDYRFYRKEELDPSMPFEKIAIEVLEMIEGG